MLNSTSVLTFSSSFRVNSLYVGGKRGSFLALNTLSKSIPVSWLSKAWTLSSWTLTDGELAACALQSRLLDNKHCLRKKERDRLAIMGSHVVGAHYLETTGTTYIPGSRTDSGSRAVLTYGDLYQTKPPASTCTCNDLCNTIWSIKKFKHHFSDTVIHLQDIVWEKLPLSITRISVYVIIGLVN